MTACVFLSCERVSSPDSSVYARVGRRAREKKGKTRGSVFLTSSLHYLQFGSQSSFVHKAFVTRLST